MVSNAVNSNGLSYKDTPNTNGSAGGSLEANIISSIKLNFQKNVEACIKEIENNITASEQECKQLSEEADKMAATLLECTKVIDEAKRSVPEQVVQVDPNNILEASKHQRLPPHLVNRLMSRPSLPSSTVTSELPQSSSLAQDTLDRFNIQPPPLPPYVPPSSAIHVNGNIIIIPVQPAITLLASAVEEGISIRGELDSRYLGTNFQPASNYELFSFTPTGNDSMRIHLGIAWTKIAVITASQLPFNFVAVNLPRNNVHFFVIRGIDVLGRIGPWSNIVQAVST